jgi:hypothetical protein
MYAHTRKSRKMRSGDRWGPIMRSTTANPATWKSADSDIASRNGSYLTELPHVGSIFVPVSSEAYILTGPADHVPKEKRMT